MGDAAIRVEGLGKSYRIGVRQEKYRTLRDTLADLALRPARLIRSLATRNGNTGAPQEEIFWALKDMSFEIQRGEVVGVIGRNGAGKSTLLRILSRITEPDEGYADINGRVGSLLEVGTGFHQELTGRENLYLSGAILGMKRAEMSRKFDEIVSFAEVAKFIDTPVKHYSSGMYLRLAFAVAAHLDPAILLVDEVLAVGDAEFQRKCLGKMGEVAREGRTILFVSHNMQAVQSLCKKALHLDRGRLVRSGPATEIVTEYVAAFTSLDTQAVWDEASAPGNAELRLRAVRVLDADDAPRGTFSTSQDIVVEMAFTAATLHSSLCVGFDLVTSQGEVVLRSYQTDQLAAQWPVVRPGMNVWRCVIPRGLLNATVYHICPRIGMHGMYWIVNQDGVVKFQTVLDHGVSPFWNVIQESNRPGAIAPILGWTGA